MIIHTTHICTTHTHKGFTHREPHIQYKDSQLTAQTHKGKGEGHTHTHTKEGWEQRIVGDVSLGVVTGVRAESASDSGAVLLNETQQSLYLRDSFNPALSLLSFSFFLSLTLDLFSVSSFSFSLSLLPCFPTLILTRDKS